MLKDQAQVAFHIAALDHIVHALRPPADVVAPAHSIVPRRSDLSSYSSAFQPRVQPGQRRRKE